MPILNYRTKIDASQTVLEIQAKLVRAGARSVLVEYADLGEPTSLTFVVKTALADEGYRLPANVDGVFRALTRAADAGQVRRAFVTRQHARRVAWRILKDWVEAQLAIIDAGLVTLDEILLPYMLGPDGRTVYTLYTERRLALPPAASGD